MELTRRWSSAAYGWRAKMMSWNFFSEKLYPLNSKARAQDRVSIWHALETKITKTNSRYCFWRDDKTLAARPDETWLCYSKLLTLKQWTRILMIRKYSSNLDSYSEKFKMQIDGWRPDWRKQKRRCTRLYGRQTDWGLAAKTQTQMKSRKPDCRKSIGLVWIGLR